MSPGRSYALFALVCLIFSTTWLAIRIGLEDFRPLGSAGLRFLVAFPILLAYALVKKLAWPRAARDWAIPLGLALTMFTVPFALIYYGELTVPSGLAAVLFAAHAIFVALLAHFVLHDEPLTPARVIGILTGFAGLIVVFWDRMSGHQSWRGEAAIIACAAIQAVSSVVVRRTQKSLHPVVLSCIGCAVGALVLLAASFLFEGGPMIRLTAAGVGAILYLAIFGSVIAFSLSIHLIHELGSNRVAVSVYVTPVAALLWGHLLLGETLGRWLLLGTALVVGGV
ncbi:MAG: EamA family transporter, partial [Candidatus Eisenbacteria bacterium]